MAPQRYKTLRLITMAIALAGLILIWKSNTPDSMEGVPFQSEPNTEIEKPVKPSEELAPRFPNQKKVPVVQNQEKDEETPDLPPFSFEAEVAKVKQLVAQFPNTRRQLIQVINQPDPFKEKGIEVKPHTLSEQMQMKMGAVKVMALRELMRSEKNLAQLSKDLKRVAQSANDPTIRRIAEAADESLGQGRSFFDDFLNGIEGMAL